MSKPATLRRVRTAAALRADAHLLSGPAPVVAAADDDAQPAEPGSTIGELWLYGVVGGWWRGFDAESVSRALRGMGDVDTLYVRIHSPGGLAGEGVAIANLLRNFNARVVTVVDGVAASAASVIAVAGDEVVICPGAQLMLHDAATGMYVWGDAELLRSAGADLERLATWIDAQSQNYAGIYAYKAGGTAEQWRTVMTANGLMGTWYSGEAAVAAKLADRVGTVTAVGSPPVAPDEDVDWDDDELLARVEHDLVLLEREVPAAARAAWSGEHPKPPSASAVGSTHTEGGSAVSLSDQAVTTLRTRLGIAEDADEATILAALDEALDERAEPQAAANVPDGHVVIPAVQLQELKDGAAMGVKAAQTLHERDREAFLDANKAKYAAGNRAAWAKEYDRDPEGTRKHFAEAPDLIPADLLGHENDGVDREDGDAQAAATEQPGYKNWRF